MNNKKVILLFISLVFMINLAAIVFAQEVTDFSLVEIFETVRGFDVAEAYGTFPFLIDTIIYFILFISIAQVTLGKQFEGPGGRGVVIAVGLAMAVAISFWAKNVGFTLGNLGPLAGLILALIIGIKIYRLLRGNESVGSGIWISIIVLYIGAFMFFPEIITALQTSKAGRLGLAILNIAFIIALPMAIISLFRTGGGGPGPGPGPGPRPDPPVPPPGRGNLALTTNPGDANVRVQGHPEITGAGTYPLDPGNYQINVSKANYVDKTVPARIVAGQTTTVNVILDPGPFPPPPGRGNLALTTNPGDANVRVQGHPEITGAGTYPLDPGNYQINVSKANYVDKTVPARIVAGQTTTVNVILDPGPFPPPPGRGNLALTTNPGDANVSVPNHPEITGAGTYPLDPGTYQVTASKATYTPKIMPAIIIANQTTPLHIDLEPGPVPPPPINGNPYDEEKKVFYKLKLLKNSMNHLIRGNCRDETELGKVEKRYDEVLIEVDVLQNILKREIEVHPLTEAYFDRLQVDASKRRVLERLFQTEINVYTKFRELMNSIEASKMTAHSYTKDVNKTIDELRVIWGQTKKLVIDAMKAVELLIRLEADEKNVLHKIGAFNI